MAMEMLEQACPPAGLKTQQALQDSGSYCYGLFGLKGALRDPYLGPNTRLGA